MASHTQHASSAYESKVTHDHRKIQKWAEERGGKPASVRGTEGESCEPGVLRIDFPGGTGEDVLQHITWEEFFEKFDEKKLDFLYQEHTKDGGESRFFKLISRGSAN